MTIKNRTIIIPPHGGYRKLKSYQTATLIYDLTVEFCKRYMSYKANRTNTRTYDQMVQAARSGRTPVEHLLAPEVYSLASQGHVYGARNIAEGSQTSGTSKKTELKLVNVARASLEELLLDYEDFLRQRNMLLWSKSDTRTQEVRKLAYRSHRTYMTYAGFLRKPEEAANMLICLIHQACYLLDRQIAALEKEFLTKGGFSENLYHQRTEERKKQLAKKGFGYSKKEK